jgi:hypothetical protein
MYEPLTLPFSEHKIFEAVVVVQDNFIKYIFKMEKFPKYITKFLITKLSIS